MRTFILVVLLAAVVDSKAIRNRRAISEFTNNGGQPSIVISDTNDGSQGEIDSYKSMLEMLLRQLAAIEQKTNPGAATSAELADDYQREYYTAAASEVVQKLLQYGALSAIVDAENAAFYEENEGASEEEPSDVIRVSIDGNVPSTGDNGEEEPFTEEQAHEVLKLIIEELMDKFFADLKNTHVFVLAAEGNKTSEEEEGEEESGETDPNAEGDDDSSSSSSSEEEYYYGDSEEEYDDYTMNGDDDAVIVVNKQVSTNIIRIPTATFVEALTKLLPTFKTYPAHLQQLTPLQVEDPRVYAEHGELTGSKPTTAGSGSEQVHPPVHVSSHSVSPIASVSPTAAAAVVETTKHSTLSRYAFDLGHVLVCIAAALLILWAIVQLVAMYRRRNEPTGPAPAMALPPKVIPTSTIIPNIYATPPAVRHQPPTPVADEEKPPVYVEKQEKPEA